LKYVGL